MATETDPDLRAPGGRAADAPARGDRADRAGRADVGGRQPKYLRIHCELSDRIASGQWPAGSPLPSQQQLAAQFGVSVMALRQAIQLKADDGVIQTRRGSVGFVAVRY